MCERERQRASGRERDKIDILLWWLLIYGSFVMEGKTTFLWSRVESRELAWPLFTLTCVLSVFMRVVNGKINLP